MKRAAPEFVNIDIHISVWVGMPEQMMLGYLNVECENEKRL